MFKQMLAAVACLAVIVTVGVGEMSATRIVGPPMANLTPVTTSFLSQMKVAPGPGASTQAEEQALMWCTDNWVDGGWEHDFDIFYTTGAQCFEGTPNTIHLYSQPNYCGMHHYPGTICPGW